MIYKIVGNSSNREKEKKNDNSRFIVGKAVREPHITSRGTADSSGSVKGSVKCDCSTMTARDAASQPCTDQKLCHCLITAK